MSDEKRAQVVEEALSWIGTPYHHAASVKGAGADCGTLLIEVYSRCDVIEKFKPRKYSRQFHLHRDEEWYKRYVESWATPVDTPQMGDICLFKVGRLFSHGAVVIDWPHVVHAMAREEFVIKDDVSKGWLFGVERLFFDPFRGPAK